MTNATRIVIYEGKKGDAPSDFVNIDGTVYRLGAEVEVEPDVAKALLERTDFKFRTPEQAEKAEKPKS